MKKNRTFMRGFTLIELLVVVAVIGILAAILLPVVLGGIQSANQAKGLSGLRQIGVGIMLFTQDHNNRYPPATVSTLTGVSGGTMSNAGVPYFIIPYLGFSGIPAINASRILVDPLAANASLIGKLDPTQIGWTYSSNLRILGTASTANANLSSITYSIASPSIYVTAVTRPGQTVLVGSAVVQEGKTWGSYLTYGTPTDIVTGTNPGEVVQPGAGNSYNTGGTLGGIAWRANHNTAATFLMADGSVQVIARNQLTVGNFMSSY